MKAKRLSFFLSSLFVVVAYAHLLGTGICLRVINKQTVYPYVCAVPFFLSRYHSDHVGLMDNLSLQW